MLQNGALHERCLVARKSSASEETPALFVVVERGRDHRSTSIVKEFNIAICPLGRSMFSQHTVHPVEYPRILERVSCIQEVDVVTLRQSQPMVHGGEYSSRRFPSIVRCEARQRGNESRNFIAVG